MRATLNIPNDLMTEVQKLSGEKSKTKAIVIAMEEFVHEKKIKKLLSLRGKVQIDYDWQKEEDMEMKSQAEREAFFEK